MHESPETCTLRQKKRGKPRRIHTEVCTKPRKDAHFGRKRGETTENPYQSVHETPEICTLRQRKEGKPRRTHTKVCTKPGKMHTSAEKEGKPRRIHTEVCTKPRKHAHFGREKRGNHGEPIPKCARKQERCTLRPFFDVFGLSLSGKKKYNYGS